ncbi:hypothetical protein H2201_009433, partial [Coniosporium apollinis]
GKRLPRLSERTVGIRHHDHPPLRRVAGAHGTHPGRGADHAGAGPASREDHRPGGQYRPDGSRSGPA